MKTTIDLEAMQRLDHDTLVRVEAKMDNLSADVKVMGDGIQAKLNDHELRVRKLEDLTISVQPLEQIKKLHEVEKKVDGLERLQWLVGIIGGLIVFVVTQLPNWFRIFFK